MTSSKKNSQTFNSERKPAVTKPSMPQGTRDFGPEIMHKRNFIFNTIRNVFELYGFQPLETPAFENLETLLGKYGEEGDKLIFRILNNGLDNLSKKNQAREAFENILEGKSTKLITERALKYDLTIPFARFVAMNHPILNFPFKRYQMQPVWRADRPQKGRYREFYQCDADVVGSHSILNEVECVNMYQDVFSRLGMTNFDIRINSRNILSALADKTGGADKLVEITTAIDKLDKTGIDKVKEDLFVKGLNKDDVKTIESYLNISGTNNEKLQKAASLLGDSPTVQKTIEELKFVLQNTNTGAGHVTIDLTLARGLNYYTGMIFEARAPKEIKIGSIGGGGRYDDLTGLFGVPDVPGVGISFGVDRIYDVMEEMELFPQTVLKSTAVLFFHLGNKEAETAYTFVKALRKMGIASEIYHEQARFDKQFKYAEKKQIPYAAIIGSKELEEKVCNIKDLRSGQQKTIPFANLSDFLFI